MFISKYRYLCVSINLTQNWLVWSLAYRILTDSVIAVWYLFVYFLVTQTKQLVVKYGVHIFCTFILYFAGKLSWRLGVYHNAAIFLYFQRPFQICPVLETRSAQSLIFFTPTPVLKIDSLFHTGIWLLITVFCTGYVFAMHLVFILTYALSIPGLTTTHACIIFKHS